MKRTKAGLSAPFMLIAGLLIFAILFFTSCNGIKEAFKNYDNSIKSTDTLITALEEVSAKQPGSLKLVPLNLDKDSAIYIFNPTKIAVVEDITNDVGTLMKSEIIARPKECKMDETCVCLCNSAFLKSYDKDSFEWKQLSEEYDVQSELFSKGIYFYKLECKQLSCNTIQDVEIKEEIKLKDIIYDYEGYVESYEQIVFVWKQGFSIWNTDKVEFRTKAKSHTKSNYIDIFVIKNSDGTLRLCYDSKCKET